MGCTQNVGFQLMMAANKYRRALDAAVVKRTGITSAQGHALDYIGKLSRERDVFQKDIEAAFDLRGSTVTGIIRLLEERGDLTRESVACDARLKKICLTEKARKKHEEIMEVIAEQEAALQALFSEAEKAALIQLLSRIAKSDI